MEKDLDNEKVEQTIPQYAETIIQTKYLEEHVFATKLCTNQGCRWAQCNILLVMIHNARINATTSANLLQKNEIKVEQRH